MVGYFFNRLKYVEQMGVCDGKATIIGATQKTSPRFAALVNGISIHADDFDDTQLAAARDRVYGLLMHPTVPVPPAIFALGEQRAVTGKQWMLTYHVGAEVECKIAEAIAPRHYEDGFHTTGTCGPLGLPSWGARLPAGVSSQDSANRRLGDQWTQFLYERGREAPAAG